MNTKELTRSFRKHLCLLFHLLLLAVTLTGITLAYLNDNFGSGLAGISSTEYADSLDCSNRINQDVEDIFKYIFYQDVFETDGILDFSKGIVTIQSGPGQEETYTIDAMIRYAKNRGYYLNESFDVIGGSGRNSSNDLSDVYIIARTYKPNIRYNEPGEAYANMEELAVEVLSLLGDYYTAKSKFIDNPSNLYFTILYQNSDQEQRLISNAGERSVKQLMALGRYFYLTGDSVIPETNMQRPPIKVASLLESYNSFHTSDYYMILALDTEFGHQDSYAQAANQFRQEHNRYVIGLFLAILGLLGMIITLILVMKEIRDGMSAKPRFSIEGNIIFICLCVLAAYYLSNFVGNKFAHLLVDENYWYYGEALLRSLILYFGILGLTMLLVNHFYSGTLASKSKLYKRYKAIILYINNSTYTKYVIIFYIFYFVLTLISIVFLVYCWMNRGSFIYNILFILCCLILVAEHLYLFYQMLRESYSKKKIEDAIHHISSGDTSFQIDLTSFSTKESTLAKQINEIGSGLEAAIQEKVKSERLKADLITNVSHDIKTPLTSIINYVDLLKREKIQNEKIQQYLDVLDQKSQRLKTLTEDLVEASKASSGNLKLEMSKINFISLVQQTNGEFEEKFASRDLTLVTTFPDEIIYISADGRRLWRVLENLYNNAFKYAMTNSRVYIDINKDDSNIVFTIKNVSENPLNIHVDELTERFVRGDVARTTEGSGLGLSIAKSLTALQGGEFEIIIDGDLFKAELRFPIIPCNEQKEQRHD